MHGDMHGSNCVLTLACAAWNASESRRTALWEASRMLNGAAGWLSPATQAA